MAVGWVAACAAWMRESDGMVDEDIQLGPLGESEEVRAGTWARVFTAKTLLFSQDQRSLTLRDLVVNTVSSTIIKLVHTPTRYR
jgi:hypothetical protein